MKEEKTHKEATRSNEEESLPQERIFLLVGVSSLGVVAAVGLRTLSPQYYVYHRHHRQGPLSLPLSPRLRLDISVWLHFLIVFLSCTVTFIPSLSVHCFQARINIPYCSDSFV